MKSIKFVFEDIPDNMTFANSVGNYTWAELKEKLLKQFETPRVKTLLKKHKIRRVEIGSIFWFHHRKKIGKNQRLISLSTMHMARLLQR